MCQCHRHAAACVVDPDTPPPGPFRAGFWRSPLRGPWLTAVLGLVLLIGLPIVIVTGLLSNDAYQPGLGGNALGRDTSARWTSTCSGGRRARPGCTPLTQGLHVTVGLALFPVLLAKLWSVIPRLFEWPPVRSPAHALERLSLALLVGGALFEFVTGILNIQYWYAFPFFFTQAHYYGAWVFIGAFLVHVTLKFGDDAPVAADPREVLATRPAEAAPVPGPRRRWPRRPRRRDDVAAGAAGHGRRRARALLLGSRAPPSRSADRSAGWPSCSRAGATGPGPLGFPVNKTAAAVGHLAARAWARAGG